MRPLKLHVPKDVQEVIVLLTWMLVNAPTFVDKSGYFPGLNVGHVFQQLTEGLGNIRQTLGEERYNRLVQMSGQMRALFEADPEDKTGDTVKGCKIIHEMEDILRQVQR